MADYLPGNEPTLVCPYNKSHVILRSGFLKHLTKCRINNPDIILEVCPFNVMHRFSAKDRTAHINECPSKINFERLVGNPCFKPPIPCSKPPQMVQSQKESWDPPEGEQFESYNPQKYAKEANVLRQPPPGLNKTNKVKFYAAERKRLSNFRAE